MAKKQDFNPKWYTESKRTRTFQGRWYTEALLQELKATEKVRMDGNLPIYEKHHPGAVSDVAVDPTILNGMMGKSARMMALLPKFLLDKVKITVNDKYLKTLRKTCSTDYTSKCVRENIIVEERFLVTEDGYKMPLRIYRSENCAPGCGCVYFTHGGAFVAGTLEPYDECWKLFVEKFHMVVVAVDYRLMPENPFPVPHEDCWRGLEWVHEHAGELNIDPTRVFVAGDSAGGNLAQYCSTRAKGTGMVRGQILLYATLNPFCVVDEYFDPKKQDNFIFEPSQKKVSRCIVKQLEMMVSGFSTAFGEVDPNPIISPYTHDAAGNPPTLMAVGSLDYLKLDMVAWAHKLQDAGVPVRLVVYNGLGHGTIQSVGVLPQAEDIVDEMGKFVLGNL